MQHLRDQAAMYRKLAEQTDDPVVKNEMLELASVGVEVANNMGPDPRRALGPAATPAALTGRTRDRTRPMLQKCQKVLAMAPSTRDPKATSRNGPESN